LPPSSHPPPSQASCLQPDMLLPLVPGTTGFYTERSTYPTACWSGAPWGHVNSHQRRGLPPVSAACCRHIPASMLRMLELVGAHAGMGRRRAAPQALARQTKGGMHTAATPAFHPLCHYQPIALRSSGWRGRLPFIEVPQISVSVERLGVHQGGYKSYNMVLLWRLVPAQPGSQANRHRWPDVPVYEWN
jgi:hypothetical protein